MFYFKITNLIIPLNKKLPGTVVELVVLEVVVVIGVVMVVVVIVGSIIIK